MTGEPRFDVVFSQFYENEPKQVRALVAYGLCKIAKREWTSGFHERQAGPPSIADIDAYHASWTASMIYGKQAEADAILRDYGSTIIAAEKPRIVEDALHGTSIRAMAVNIGSAFLYTLILVGIVVVLRFAGVDILSLAGPAP